ncbi:hypothetical protein [Microtetraspora sp. NBRC 13810]|uniref:hypothetical protein n=1 Tax=Microtetraspora sp. NBRC 13810 TaxID=3030990 RepID=UPI002557A1B8|nr:hypothetical protein [Microtetraspora sp. NBRC 13810]
MKDLHVPLEVVRQHVITTPIVDDSFSKFESQANVTGPIAAHQSPVLNVGSQDGRMLGQRGLLAWVAAAPQPSLMAQADDLF